jgi:anaerobic magnesium-protoporphyrin IX monomethyl ester cyclase
VNRVAHASRRVSVDSVARVLFAHGHLLRWDAKQFAIGKPYPPLATLYAAAHARALGHEVALYDPMLNDDTSDFGRALDREKPDVVVLYDDSFNWFTKMCLSRMRAAAHGMVSDARARGLPVVVAGHDAADDPETYLRSGAAFVIVGEGEVTLGELLAHFDAAIAAGQARGTGANVDDVREAATATAGLALLHKGFLRRTGARKLLKDLDVLPLPAWDLVDVGRYRSFWRRRHGYFSLNVVTTRGCPYLCNWCAKPVYGNTYHTRSPANVLAELRLLRDRYAPDHLWFCDDILGLKSRWLVAWSDAVAAEGLRTPFLCQTRADLMTEDNVRALRRAGAREVWLGAESGAQPILDAMEKGISVDQTRAAVARLRASGVRVGLFLQFGYPGEGWDEVQATRAMVRELLPDDIGISVSYPLPGTRYHERMAARLGPKRNWSESSDLDPLVPGRFSPGFYKMLSRVVHAELRVLRGARALKTLVGHPLRLDSYRVRRAAEVRHAGPWLLDRVRLEAERRRSSIDTGEAGSYAAGNSSAGD